MDPKPICRLVKLWQQWMRGHRESKQPANCGEKASQNQSEDGTNHAEFDEERRQMDTPAIDITVVIPLFKTAWRKSPDR